MSLNENIAFWQTVFTGLAFITAGFAAYLAYKLGKKQNEISSLALRLGNFVEIFLMPQQLMLQDADDSNNKKMFWNILIKNVSSYPIYLNNFTLNGVKHDLGSNAVPNDPSNWYAFPVPEDVQNKGEFSLLIEFEDYQGKRYRTDGYGKFENYSWQIRTKKRIEI